MSVGQLLSAYWGQSLRRSNWWQPVKPDGMDVALVGNLIALDACALTHLCPRCLAQTNRVQGDTVICGRCRMRSPALYRNVRVLVQRGAESQMVERLELLSLRDLNPVGLRHEMTTIDLSDWDLFERDPVLTWPGYEP